jgi:hypothetical protein
VIFVCDQAGIFAAQNPLDALVHGLRGLPIPAYLLLRYVFQPCVRCSHQPQRRFRQICAGG